MEEEKRGWCDLGFPLHSLAFLLHYPFSLQVWPLSQRRGGRLNPVPKVRKPVSGGATMPAGGLRFCPRFIFRHFERHKQLSREKALSLSLHLLCHSPCPFTKEPF